MINDLIDIGSFSERLVFDYFIVLHEEPLEQFGEILKDALGESFLLLPRTSFTNGTTFYHSSLCLIYTPKTAYDLDIITNKIKSINYNIKTSMPILSNGNVVMRERPNTITRDKDMNSQYLIGYTFNDNKYKYYLSMGSDFTSVISMLVTRVPKVTLDKLFSGKTNDGYRNVFEFNRFKVRDFTLGSNKIIVSNGANTIDNIGDASIWNMISGTWLINVLPDFTFPGETSKNIRGVNEQYYGLYKLMLSTIIPESLIKAAHECGFTYNHKGKEKVSKQGMIPGSNDRTLMIKIMREYLRDATTGASRVYFGDRMTVEEVLTVFNESRIKKDRELLNKRYTECVQNILDCNREIATLMNDIAEIEARSQNRLPIPIIEIKKECLNQFSLNESVSKYGIMRGNYNYKGYELPLRVLIKNKNGIPTIEINNAIMEGEI